MDTTALLASVRQRAMLPDSPSAGTTDTDLLRYATEELQSRLTPWLLRVREEYLVDTQETAVVAGQAAYRVPSRAVGGKLRDVVLVRGRNLRSLPRLAPEDVEFLPEAGQPQAFLMRGANVVLVPAPDSAGDTLRLTYHRRPARLVLPEEVATASSVVGDAVTATGTLPAGFTNGALVDVVRGTSPFEVVAAGVALADVGVTTFTLSDVEAGDYVCLTGTSPVPQVPEELHVLLAQQVAAKVLEALGDDAGLQRARAVLADAEGLALAAVSPRVEGEPKLIVTRRGLLHQGPSYRMWW